MWAIVRITSKHLSAGILTSSQMGSYDTSKTYLKKQYPTYFPESFRTHVACSGIAGVVCSLTSAPGESC